tara:strand:+ start:316 stop:618 length:303 start_codon:yes stop_codon:yes gene_type:complete
MRISSVNLRRIIRSIILEDIEMRSRLSPLKKSGNIVDDSFRKVNVTKNEEDEINNIIIMPLTDDREERITDFGRNRYEEICKVLDLKPYKQYKYQISLSR